MIQPETTLRLSHTQMQHRLWSMNKLGPALKLERVLFSTGALAFQVFPSQIRRILWGSKPTATNGQQRSVLLSPPALGEEERL